MGHMEENQVILSNNRLSHLNNLDLSLLMNSGIYMTKSETRKTNQLNPVKTKTKTTKQTEKQLWANNDLF